MNRVARCAVASLLAAASLLGGCKDPTAIVVSIATDLRVPEELDYLQVKVQMEGGPEKTAGFDLHDEELPATLTLLPPDRLDAKVLVTVVGKHGGANGETVVLRRARTLFFSERVLLLRMELRRSCAAVYESCGAEQTCVDGVCVAVEINPWLLPEYDEGEALVGIDAADGGVPEAGGDGGDLESDADLCGNDAIDPGEDCEEGDLDGEDCASRGYTAGTLRCASCSFDESRCWKSLDSDPVAFGLGTTESVRFPRVGSSGGGFFVTAEETFGLEIDIRGATIGTTGGPGAPVQVTSDSWVQYVAAVAGGEQQYLVAWSDRPDGSGDGISARIVSAAGEPQGSGGVEISKEEESGKKGVAIAHDGQNYLVVWQHNDTPKGVYCNWVTPDGQPINESWNDTPVAADEIAFPNDPDVACGTDRCLVVWRETADDIDTWGRFFSISESDPDPKAGFAMGDAFVISAAAVGQFEPAVAFDGTGFFVVWTDTRTSEKDVWGVRVLNDGTLDGDEIRIAKSARHESEPAIACAAGRCLVAWDVYDEEFPPNSTVIRGAWIADGELVQPAPFDVVEETAGVDQRDPQIAAAGTVFLVVWSDKTASPWTVKGRRYSVP